MLARAAVNSITVKSIGPFDLGRLTRLHRACFEDSWSRTDLAHLLALPGGFGLLARLYEGGFSGLDAMRGVGFSICRIAADECELLSIGVNPSYRRRHVGDALLQESMRRCRAAGAVVMFLEVAVDNAAAQLLYTRHGFEQVGIRLDYYNRANGRRMDAYTMRCPLVESLDVRI